MEGWMDGWMEGWMDWWMDGWMEGWILNFTDSEKNSFSRFTISEIRIPYN